MKKINVLVLTISLFFTPLLVLAQQNQPTTVVGFQPGEPAGNVACFDFYTFGSVQANLSSALPQTVPGATISFSGKLKNTNDYPLTDGMLYVKIFKRNAEFSASQGDSLVEQFAVQEVFTLPAKGEKNISVNWKVPNNLPAGNYSAAFFFLTVDRFNLLGLPFTDDVTGQRVPFSVSNTEETPLVTFDRSKVSLNNQSYNFIGQPPFFGAQEEVVVRVNLSNPTNEVKTIPVSWKEYRWDSLQTENARNNKEEAVTLAPNETKELSYAVAPKVDAVTYLVVEAADGGTKSILDIRFARNDVQDTRLNFAGIQNYPLRADQENALNACAHAISYTSVPDTELQLTLRDRAGEVIHKYEYKGEQTGKMGGFQSKFTPKRDYANMILTATLIQQGEVKEEAIIEYSCQDIDPALCESIQDPKASSGLLSNIFYKFLTLLAIIIVVLLVLVAFKRMRKPPVQFMWFLAFLIGTGMLFGLGTDTAEATKNSRIQGTANIWTDIANGVSAHGPAHYTVDYYADAIDADTEQPIADGSTLSIGNRIKFVPKPRTDRNDVFWVFSGSVIGTPYGYWGNPPINFCQIENHIGGGQDAMGVHHSVYLTFSASPTSTETNVGGTAGLVDAGVDGAGNRIYLIQSAGSISADIRFLSTDANFIFRVTSQNNPSCGGGVANENVSLPERTINFDLTVPGGASNQRPNAPTIVGPVSGSPDIDYTFTATATDPDGDQIRYQFDWDRNGVPDECSPSNCSLVNSGISRSVDRTWSSQGAKSFQVRVQDSFNQYSTWTTHTITLTNYSGQSGYCGQATTISHASSPPADQLCVAPSTPPPAGATLTGYSWSWTCTTPAVTGNCPGPTSGNCEAQGYEYVFGPEDYRPAQCSQAGYCCESAGSSHSLYQKNCTPGSSAYSYSCLAPYESGPPNSLKLCESSCGSGVQIPSSFTMARNSSRDIVACWNGASGCTDGAGNVTTSAIWNEGGGSTISLSGNDPNRISADNSGAESVTANYGGQNTSTNITVTCVPTITCDNAPGKENYCQDEEFTVDNGCGINLECNGIKTCNYNWKEVAP